MMKRSNASPPPRFYSVRQVANMLSVSPRSVYRWISEGELLVHKFGRSVRISHPDLMAFLATHRDD
jgi:excisionase family DNA binding protein